jgi:hypothetical protein
MRRVLTGLLIVLVLLVAGAGAVGYSRGWFTVAKSDENKTIPFNVKVNREKVKQDTERLKAKVQDATGQNKGKAGEPATGKGKKEAATKGPGGE